MEKNENSKLQQHQEAVDRKYTQFYGVTRAELIKILDECRGDNNDPNLEPEKVLVILSGRDDLHIPGNPVKLLNYLKTFQTLGVPPYANYAYFKKSKGKEGCSLSYVGMQYLVLRELPGSIVESDVVFRNDTFEWQSMPFKQVQHLRNMMDPGEEVAVYASLTTNNGIVFAEIIPWDEIASLKHEHSHRVDKETKAKTLVKESPWLNHTHEMARKTALKKLFKKIQPHLGALDEERDTFDGEKTEQVNSPKLIEAATL